MLTALEIHELVVTEPILEQYVRRLSAEYARLVENNDSLQLHLAKREVERATQLVRMGAEGHLIIGADSFSDAETLASIILDTTKEKDQFWASSLVDSEFWVHAAAYVRQQHEKIKEGVTVNRVFIFESEKAFLNSHAQLQMALQQKEGIIVKYVVKPKVAARDIVVVRKRRPMDKRLLPQSFTVTVDPNDDDSSKKTPPTHISLQRVDLAHTDDNGGNTSTDGDGPWEETYALECKVGSDKRIEHIDLWSVNELHAEMVRRTWWALQSIFAEAKPFKPSPEVIAQLEDSEATHLQSES
jgi:hypothetical protein